MPAPLSAGDLASTDVETVGPAAPLRAVAEYLHGTDVGSVVVTDEGDAPVGIVTGRDLSRAVAAGLDLDATRVADAMTETLVTVEPTTTGVQAAATMRDHGVHHLLVVDDGGLRGVLTATDLAYALPHAAERDRATDRPDVARGEFRDMDDWAFVGGEEVAVGDEFTFSKTLSEADVEAFADATGDTNPLHLDDAYAGDTRFGGRIVHGVLTTGVVSAAVARLPGMPIYLGQDCDFTAPVRPGTRVTAELTVAEELGDARYRLTTRVRDDEGEVVLDGEARVLIDEEP
ncbi:CBS domain-containing protein [Halosegnis marinus]|uniref:CBS domain-containing protein n=1 Tax=Halosegnis marinus TaxID=3034023 RepID=A0ABD5ZNS5_9EURY|nr:CBS domain-containing protein [Halosegnis sp. DT85]